MFLTASWDVSRRGHAGEVVMVARSRRDAHQVGVRFGVLDVDAV
jgi:hypothetical protein